MSEWISVKNPPVKNCRVQVCFMGDVVDVLNYATNLMNTGYIAFRSEEYDRPGFFDGINGEVFEQTGITHWMPLSEPPERL